jgi:hypothetical protein
MVGDENELDFTGYFFSLPGHLISFPSKTWSLHRRSSWYVNLAKMTVTTMISRQETGDQRYGYGW